MLLKKSRLEQKIMIAVLLLLAGFVTPNIILLKLDSDRQHLLWLFTSAALFVVWVTACTTIRQAAIWALPVFVLMPLVSLFILAYGEFPGTNVIGILLDTSLHETHDFLSGRALQILGLSAASLTIWTLLLFLTSGEVPSSPVRLRVYAARGALLALAATMLLAMTPWASGILAISRRSTFADSNGRKVLPFYLTRLANVFPVGPLVAATDFVIGERNRHELQQRKAGMKFGAVLQPTPARKNVFVLVIGESSRSDRWQLGGYSRQTNPLLAHEPNVTYLTDVISAWTYTLGSVPVIASRKPSTDRSRFFAEPSILSLFKEAGYRTYWLSNQAQPAGIGSEIADISFEADETEWLNFAARDYARDTTYDIELAGRLRSTLAKAEPRQFIILHLLGSHDAYRSRYPKDFDKFRPSLTDMPEANDHDPANRVVIGNTYDNTILYTDYVLHSVLSVLKDSGAEAGLLYTSDHGESLFDGICDFVGHGGTAQENYTISSLIWLSDVYKGRHPEASGALERNSSRHLSTENVFDTMAEMAGINFPTARPALSILSSSFKESQRWVNVGNQTVNWDQSRFEGACRKPVERDRPIHSLVSFKK